MKKNKDEGFFGFLYHLVMYGLMIFAAGMIIYPAYSIIISLIDGVPVTWQTIKDGLAVAFYHMVLVEAVYFVLYLVAQLISFWLFMDDAIWRMKQKKEKRRKEKTDAGTQIHHCN